VQARELSDLDEVVSFCHVRSFCNAVTAILIWGSNKWMSSCYCSVTVGSLTGGPGWGFLANERPASESSWSHARHSKTAARQHITVTDNRPDQWGRLPRRVAPKLLMWRPSSRGSLRFRLSRSLWLWPPRDLLREPRHRRASGRSAPSRAAAWRVPRLGGGPCGMISAMGGPPTHRRPAVSFRRKNAYKIEK